MPSINKLAAEMGISREALTARQKRWDLGPNPEVWELFDLKGSEDIYEDEVGIAPNSAEMFKRRVSVLLRKAGVKHEINRKVATGIYNLAQQWKPD